jgi:hypothetical protein
MKMRQISKQIANAFFKGKPKTIGNTHTNGHEVFLHGNKIAWKPDNDRLAITLAGWPTPTTRERVNAVLDTFGFKYYVQQVDHTQYLTNFEDKKTGVINDRVYTFQRVGDKWPIAKEVKKC